MIPTVYYNEHDPGAAQWLRELIAAGLIPPGAVDDRDIQQVSEADIDGFTQVHLFAGIGGWPLTLRLAGWPDERPVWTGSCPCQPFSSAGKRKGSKDPRHLWPEMLRLIRLARPAVVFGEQVAGSPGRQWLAGVRADLEKLGYAFGAADLCAAGVGAPNIRQRLNWVADAGSSSTGGIHRYGGGAAASGCVEKERLGQAAVESPGCCAPGGMVNPYSDGSLARGLAAPTAGHRGAALANGGAGRVGNPQCDGRGDGGRAAANIADQPGFWSLFELVRCRDEKVRRIEPGTFPLADGIPGRVGLLRGYGNAINPHITAQFVGAFLDCEVEVLT